MEKVKYGKWTLFLVVCLIWLLLLKPAYAQQGTVTADIGGRIGVGLYAGGYFPADTEFLGEDIRVKDAFIGGGSAIWGIDRWFALELGFGRTRTEIESGVIDMEYGEVTVMPLTLTAQFRYVGERPRAYENMAVYLLGGIGYYFTDIDKSGELDIFWALTPPGFLVDLDIENAFGVHVGGGIEAFLTRNVALYAEARWFWADADMEQKLTPIAGGPVIIGKDSVDLDSAKTVVGFRMFF